MSLKHIHSGSVGPGVLVPEGTSRDTVRQTTLNGMLRGSIVTFYHSHHTDLPNSDGGFFEKNLIGPTLEHQYIKCFVVFWTDNGDIFEAGI